MEEGGSKGRGHLGSQGTEASMLGKAAMVEVKVNLTGAKAQNRMRSDVQVLEC